MQKLIEAFQKDYPRCACQLPFSFKKITIAFTPLNSIQDEYPSTADKLGGQGQSQDHADIKASLFSYAYGKNKVKHYPHNLTKIHIETNMVIRMLHPSAVHVFTNPDHFLDQRFDFIIRPDLYDDNTIYEAGDVTYQNLFLPLCSGLIFRSSIWIPFQKPEKNRLRGYKYKVF